MPVVSEIKWMCGVTKVEFLKMLHWVTCGYSNGCGGGGLIWFIQYGAHISYISVMHVLMWVYCPLQRCVPCLIRSFYLRYTILPHPQARCDKVSLEVSQVWLMMWPTWQTAYSRFPVTPTCTYLRLCVAERRTCYSVSRSVRSKW